MRDNSIVNIAVAFDDSFYMPASVMLYSLYTQCKEKIHLYLLYNSLDEKKRQQIEKQALSYGNLYTEIYIDSRWFESASLANNPLYSIEIYYRIMLPYITDVEKILWLDADTIICGDISELFHINIENRYVGACKDIAEEQGKRNQIKKCMNMEEQIYFNSGILLLNTKMIRNEIPKELFFDAIEKYAKDLVCPDQDILNFVLGKKCLLMDNRYNNLYHMNSEKKETWNQALVIHYIYKKPWNIDYYGFLEERFWSYALPCGYKKEYKKHCRIRKARAKRELWIERWNAIKRKVLGNGR